MPLYPYHCNDCEHDFERKLPMREGGEPRPCPLCGKLSPRSYIPLSVNMNGSGTRQSDPITQWQFNSLDDKPKRSLTRLSPDKVL